MIHRRFNLYLLVFLAFLLSACASNSKLIQLPISVQSNPLGAYVLLKVHRPEARNSDDWIFVGNTPVTVTREFQKEVFERGHTISIRLLKEGYFSQTKEWSGESLELEKEEKGKVFWNPKLVRH